MARVYARHVTGLDEPLHRLEPHQKEPHCRLTISVPGELEDAARSRRAAGLRPDFQEAPAPEVGDDSFTMPLSFQVRNFGPPLDPRMIENIPERMTIIAGAVEGLPDEARDILNWAFIEQDQETQAITIHWEGEADPGA